MTIQPFGWRDGETGGTPLNSANLEAMLAAAGAYADALAAPLMARTAVGDDYTAVPTDNIIAVVDTSVPRTITLADPTTVPLGQQVIVKDESGGAASNEITVVGFIDGANEVPITVNYGCLAVYCNGNGYSALTLVLTPQPLTPPVVS